MNPFHDSPEVAKVEKLRRQIFMALRIFEAQLRDPRTHRDFAAFLARLPRESRAAQARFKRRLRTAAARMQEVQRTTKR